VVTGGDLEAYGWMSAVGIVGQMILHEIFSLVAAKIYRLPLKLRYFPFGVNAAATLSAADRDVPTNAMVGMAGPLGGAIVCAVLAVIYWISGNPYFLGMACVGCFYNLFTLIPILELEGGWIAPALAPQAWLIGLILSLIELSRNFNLVLLGVVAFGFPRFVLLLRARAPREDLACTNKQRLGIGLLYFVLVLGLAALGSLWFEDLKRLVPEAMGD